jgi:hypothetical protein
MVERAGLRVQFYAIHHVHLVGPRVERLLVARRLGFDADLHVVAYGDGFVFHRLLRNAGHFVVSLFLDREVVLVVNQVVGAEAR